VSQGFKFFLSFLIFTIFTLSSCSQSNPNDGIWENELPLPTQIVIEPQTSEKVATQELVSFKASVSSSKQLSKLRLSGDVSFFSDSDDVICKNINLNEALEATCQISFESVGVHKIYAIYNGFDRYYDVSKSSVYSQTVDYDFPISTDITLNSSVSEAIQAHQVILFIATVAPNMEIDGKPLSGDISFFSEDDKILCENKQLNSRLVATCETSFYTAGVHRVYAVYNGAAKYYDTSKSALYQKTVVPNPISVNVQVLNDNEIEFNTIIKLKAYLTNLSPPLTQNGLFTFQIDGKNIEGCANLSRDECSMAPKEVGTHIFSVIYRDQEKQIEISDDLTQKILKSTSINISAKASDKSLRPFPLTIDVQCVGQCEMEEEIKSGNISVFEINPKDGKSILLDDCKDLNIISEGKVECVVQTAPPFESGRIFKAKYSDNSSDKQYASSSSYEKYVSLDSNILNSAIYIITGSGKFSYSTNGGKFWQYSHTQPAQNEKMNEELTSVFVSSIGNIYVGSSAGHVFESKDNGHSWESLGLDLENDSAVKSLQYTNLHTLLAILENGDIYSVNILDNSYTWRKEENYTANPPKISEQSPGIISTSFITPKQSTGTLAVYKNGGLMCKMRNSSMSSTSYQKVEIDNIRSAFLGIDNESQKLYLLKDGSDSIFASKLNMALNSDENQSCLNDTIQNVPQKIGELRSSEIKPSKIFVVDNIFYILRGQYIEVSVNYGKSWDLQKTPDQKTAKDIFVTPVLYAVSGKTLSGERDVKLSNDNGSTWSSLKNQLPETDTLASFDTFHVSSHGRQLYTIVVNQWGSEDLFVSENGGQKWKAVDNFLPIHNISKNDATALFVEEDENKPLEYKHFAVGHKNGVLSLFFPDLYDDGFAHEGNMCDPLEKREVSLCVINSIVPSFTKKFPWVAALYTYTNFNEERGLFSGITTLYSIIQRKYIPPDPFISIFQDNWDSTNLRFAPRHSLTVQNSYQVRFESLNIKMNGFDSVKNNIIHKLIFGFKSEEYGPYSGESYVFKAFENYPHQYSDGSFIPVNLYATNSGTLFVSFVSNKDASAEKNAGLYITTDDGVTWESLKTQPYIGKQATSTIFAKYQYSQ